MIIDPNPRDILYGKEARQKLIAGANAVANAVKVTLGPRGRHVVIDKTPRRNIRITKDGVTVAREINPIDIAENTGAQMFKKAATMTVDKAGDGTTTATVLAQSLLNSGFELVEEVGVNPVELGRGMKKAAEAVDEYLTKVARPIQSLEDIKKVSYISCNNDSELGDLIADTLHKVSADGLVVVEESKTSKTNVQVVAGMQFDTGISSTSRYFVTDAEKMEWVREGCIIAVSEIPITTNEQILPLLTRAMQLSRPILIIAKDFDDTVVHAVVNAYIRGQVNCCLVKAPGWGDLRRSRLTDIAKFTGADVFAENLGYKLTDENAINHCGEANKVIVQDGDLIIMEGGALHHHDPSYKQALDDHIKALRVEIEAETDEMERKFKERRLATLVGGTAVIRIGGMSAEEIGEKMDRADDAVHAVKCAMKKGIVPGGGVVLMHASRVAAKIAAALTEQGKEEQAKGAGLLAEALCMPAKTILENSGENVEAIFENLTFQMSNNPNYGYDSAKRVYHTDMIDAGIVDPALVSSAAVNSAVNIASIMLTTECLVNYHVTKDNYEALYNAG